MTKPTPASFRFACPHCAARLRAESDQAGQQFGCPKCGGQVIVPRPDRTADTAPVSVPAAGASASGPRPAQAAAATESKADTQPGKRGPSSVAGGPTTRVNRPPENPASAEPVYLGFACLHCGTRMHATIEQVGEEVVCLDCGVTSVVPPPGKKRDKSKRSFENIEAYEVMEADDDVRQHPELAAEAFVRIHCEVCESPVSAPRDKIGQLVECPDCGHRQMVRESVKPRRKPIPPGMEMEAQQPYELSPAEATPTADKFSSVTDDPLSRERARSYGYGEGHRAMPKLPKRPFIDGVVGFLFDRAVIGRILWLWALATASSYLIIHGTEVAMIGGIAAIFGVIWITLGLVLMLIWLVTAAAIYLTVVSETGNGNDEITWPDAVFLDWMFLGIYFLNSYLATLLPAFAIDWLVGSLISPWGRAAVYIASVYLLFPIVLLSMLENGSAIAPISVDVLRSIGRAFGTWVRFYFTALLVVLVQIAGVAMAVMGGRHIEILFEPLVIIVTTFLYYRLLGRLALCASLSISTVDADADEESAAD